MFNKLRKFTAYILVLCVLTGAWSAPAMAAGTDEEQSAPAEAASEEMYDSSSSDGGDDSNGEESGDSEDRDYSEDDHSGSNDESRDSDHSADHEEYRDENDGESADRHHNDEGPGDDGASLNDEEDRESTSGDSSGAGITGDNADKGEEYGRAGGWYDPEGNWHPDDDGDNPDAGNTSDDYAGENEPGQDGSGQSEGQDQTGSGQGGTGQGHGQGQDGAGTNPQDHPADPAAPQDPTEHPIGKRDQTVTGKPSYAKHMGDDYFRLDVASDGDGPLVFWSSDESVIDMSHTGRAYIKGTGTAVIGIQAEETEHCKKSNILRVTITVRKREQNVNVPVYYTKSVETDPFKIELTKDGNGPVIYESSNRNVATVSKTGKVTIKSVGSAKITVYAAETATCMESAAKTIHVNVGPRKTELSGNINVENNKATVEWQQQNGVSGYLIQYSTQRDFSDGKVVRAAPTSRSAEISGLTEDAYYVRIRSYKTQGGKNLYSEWSAAEAFGGKIATPAAGGILGRYSYGGIDGTGRNGGNTGDAMIGRNTGDASIGRNAGGATVSRNAGGATVGRNAGGATVGRNTGGAGIGGNIENAGKAGRIGAAVNGEEIGAAGTVAGTTGSDAGSAAGVAGTIAGTGEGRGSAPVFSTILTNPYWAVGKALSMRVTNRGSTVMRVYSAGAWLSNGIGGLFDRNLYIAAADDSELPYVDIRPGDTAELRFRSADNRMLRYSRRTELYYAFSYDGVKYAAVSGEDNSTEYVVAATGATGRPGLAVEAPEP